MENQTLTLHEIVEFLEKNPGKYFHTEQYGGMDLSTNFALIIRAWKDGELLNFDAYSRQETLTGYFADCD